MNQIKKKFLIRIILLTISFTFTMCKDKSYEFSPPIILTIDTYDIASNSAISGGEILNNGGTTIIESGICWDTIPLPTNDLVTKKKTQSDSNNFALDLTNLLPNTCYYVRAYAINFAGVSYGNQVSFITKSESSIKYFTDGRTVQYGDPLPIALDISENGEVDFTIFVEATAGNQGVRLYAGVNPIGNNKIKSGPPLDENFLNMGFIIQQNPGSVIDHSVETDQRWTSDYSSLVIRNTDNNNTVSYEGNWGNSAEIVGVHIRIGDSFHYGWLRINFDKSSEIVTLVDYAWNGVPEQGIKAGSNSN